MEPDMEEEMEQMQSNFSGTSPELNRSPKREEEDAWLGENSYRSFPKVSLVDRDDEQQVCVAVQALGHGCEHGQFPSEYLDGGCAHDGYRLEWWRSIVANSSVLKCRTRSLLIDWVSSLSSQGAMARLLPEELPCESQSSVKRQCSGRTRRFCLRNLEAEGPSLN